MNGFELLHPTVQHHVVNSLGWKSLRPFQDDVIPEILSGKHMVIVAPTAGGKTEAAFFPAVSQILSRQWRGLSVLYICPLKALLNNLNLRLQHYSRLLGLTSAMWHGDVSQSDRNQILEEHPNCLLTTPESLEVLLLSNRVDRQRLFADLRIVIVDEIHSFAGDDRGWHLLSVLSRITRFAQTEIQRIGLSATVGNPEQLCDWLAGCSSGLRTVYRLPFQSTASAQVAVDYVGSLRNAALVISRLHRGQKRLVYVDSRSRVEELGTELRKLGVRTFLTHSSLSREQRHAAEEAFSSGSDCVIVATSVLELGIDIGDLDKVIQIDSPGSVTGFLQRMGRTGRRVEAERNCLFLTTDDESLLMVSGLITLWQQGFVDSVSPPKLPLHILAQQIMALALQQRGITRRAIGEWLSGVPAFVESEPEDLDEILAWMLQHDMLWDDNGLLWFGRQGEENYGRKNFLDLFSVFLVPPVFEIMHGPHHIGSVDEATFLIKPQGPGVILLGGNSWLIKHVEWKRRVAYVEPATSRGVARWFGSGRPVSAVLARSIRSLLSSDTKMSHWSKRAAERMVTIRDQYQGITERQTTLLIRQGQLTWHNFAGTLANMALANTFQQISGAGVTADALSLSLRGISIDAAMALIDSIRQMPPELIVPRINEQAISGLKFADCLSPKLAHRLLTARYSAPEAIRECLVERVMTLSIEPFDP